MVSTSVCIATFRRPDELARLLDSLARQVGAPDFEVVVVDNDPDGSARSIAETFSSALALTYCREAMPGVAAVRNRGVTSSRGAFLAFIDDDEWARPDWLATLHRVLMETGADGVFGEIENDFDPGVPPHIQLCGFFDKSRFADRVEIPWWGTRTGNAYVRRAALPAHDTPFDLAYGLTGGEDSHMFKAMLDKGALFVWSSAAVVHSRHPPARANLTWAISRALRYGGTGTEIEWLDLPFRRRLKLGRRAAKAALLDMFRAAYNWRHDKARATRLILSAAMATGRVGRLLGYRVQIYRRAGQRK